MIMANYFEMSKDQLRAEKAALEQSYAEFKAKGLKLNMARGKPGPHQMDLAMDLLKMSDYTTENGYDARNYGNLEGLEEARALFGDVMGVKSSEVFVGGNSSLQLMYNLISIGHTFGFPESPCPWSQVEHRKFLCPAPGYDRHFKITEEFGFELITIPMTPDGPDMDMVEKLVAEDDTIKGIWCVPQYSNPDGYVYSDETIRRFASMKTAAPDFKIFWDEAYIVHHLTDEIIETPVLLNESKQYGTEDRVFMFTSTSKITFPGAGVSALACSEKSLAYICRRFSVMIISYDKMNQLRHVRFLKNKDGVLQHMAKHRRRLVPCFDAVKTTFAHELTPCGDIAHWTNPKGGYFISLYVMPGCAKRVAQLCKDCGLTLTGAGAAFPYGIDPQDSHLRIAPTYPSLSEVETASMLLTVCVRLAVVEKLLAEKAPKDNLAFVGDGINDAPVLTRADIGIAMGAMGSDAAIEAADVVLMDDDPLQIAKAIRISRKCIGIVRQNIVFSLIVKFACLALTAAGITNMWAAIFADVGVMILAVLNAIRALRVHNL